MMVETLIYPFSMGKRSLVLVLPYPWSMYLFIARGMVILVVGIRRHLKEFKLRGESGLIVVEEGMLTYPAVVAGAVQKVSFQLNDVQNVGYEKEDEDFIVVTNASKEHTFNKTYFRDLTEFNRFRDLFRKK